MDQLQNTEQNHSRNQVIIKAKIYKYPLLENLLKLIRAPNTTSPVEYLTHGNFQYFHYGCDYVNDHGWGCAYRTLQSMCSWILHLHQKESVDYVPSIKEIQQILVQLGDKPSSFVDSHDWIGALEVCYVIDYLYQVSCKIIHITREEDVGNYIENLKNYFQEYGGFIMMGGDMDASSKGIAGVYTHEDQSYLLVVDPHYSGGMNTSIEELMNKGYIRWQNVKEFFDTSYYNLCLPCAK